MEPLKFDADTGACLWEEEVASCAATTTTTTTTTATTTTRNPHIKCGFGIPSNFAESEELLKRLTE